MEIEDVIAYASSLPEAEQEYKESWECILLKIRGKMFVLIPLNQAYEPAINLKCDPEKAVELRMHYPGITEGYHMNKKHWNTVFLHKQVPAELIREMIRHSYESVIAGLPKSKKEGLI